MYLFFSLFATYVWMYLFISIVLFYSSYYLLICLSFIYLFIHSLIHSSVYYFFIIYLQMCSSVSHSALPWETSKARGRLPLSKSRRPCLTRPYKGSMYVQNMEIWTLIQYKLSYRCKESHCGDKAVVWSSNLHEGILYTGKTASLY